MIVIDKRNNYQVINSQIKNIINFMNIQINMRKFLKLRLKSKVDIEGIKLEKNIENKKLICF